MINNILNLVVNKNNTQFASSIKLNNIVESIGEVIFSKGNVLIVKINDSFIFLENMSQKNFQIGTPIVIKFMDVVPDSKKTIQTKYLGESSQESLKINIKFSSNITSNFIEITSKQGSENLKIKVSTWIAEFVHALNKNLEKSFVPFNNNKEVISLNTFIKKLLEIFLRSFKNSSVSVPSPIEISDKLSRIIEKVFNDQKVTDESSNLYKKIKESNELFKELTDLTFEKTKSYENEKITNKLLNSYLELQNLSMEQKTPMILTLLFGIPIFSMIERQYEKDFSKFQSDVSHKIDLLMLTKNFGVVEFVISSYRNEIYIDFDAENNREFFSLNVKQLIESLELKEYKVKRISLF